MLKRTSGSNRKRHKIGKKLNGPFFFTKQYTFYEY